MGKLKGVTVLLFEQEMTGKDPFGNPIFSENKIAVDNVIVSPTSTDDRVNQLHLTGKQAVYTLGIPKGDSNDWEDKYVEFFGKRWRTFGVTLEGIETLIPLDWNKKVLVEYFGEINKIST